MTLFKNKYRVESTRLPAWNYSSAGYYYVTICTKDRAHFLGDVRTGDVALTEIGEIVAEEWLKTEIVRPNVKLDEWIIMPNHLHGILLITHQIKNVETPRRGVSTPQHTKTLAASKKWAANTLGSIIGQFKGKCTKRIRAQGFNEFAWQMRFFDRIIRSEEALYKARHYIASNPVNWDKDQDNLAGLYM